MVRPHSWGYANSRAIEKVFSFGRAKRKKNYRRGSVAQIYLSDDTNVRHAAKKKLPVDEKLRKEKKNLLRMHTLTKKGHRRRPWATTYCCVGGSEPEFAKDLVVVVVCRFDVAAAADCGCPSAIGCCYCVEGTYPGGAAAEEGTRDVAVELESAHLGGTEIDIDSGRPAAEHGGRGAVVLFEQRLHFGSFDCHTSSHYCVGMTVVAVGWGQFAASDFVHCTTRPTQRANCAANCPAVL